MKKEYDYKGYTMTHTGKGRGRWYVKGAGIQGPKFFYSPHRATSYIDAVIKQNKRSSSPTNETDSASLPDYIVNTIIFIVVVFIVIMIFS